MFNAMELSRNGFSKQELREMYEQFVACGDVESLRKLYDDFIEAGAVWQSDLDRVITENDEIYALKMQYETACKSRDLDMIYLLRGSLIKSGIIDADEFQAVVMSLVPAEQDTSFPALLSKQQERKYQEERALLLGR